jgi:hypothetical protein
MLADIKDWNKANEAYLSFFESPSHAVLLLQLGWHLMQKLK